MNAIRETEAVPPKHCADPVILTMAGSDSGGGAGIQADLKTIMALGGFGLSVITALTAQNGLEVRGIHEPPAEFAALQLQTVLDGFPVAAAKTGMLASAPIIQALAALLRDKDFPLVVDPVAVSQSGHRLLREDALEALRVHMLPLADLLTPNKPEAEALTGLDITGGKQLRAAVDKLHRMGAKAVLIKGGHFAEFTRTERIPDWLALPGEEPLALTHERIPTSNNHGTGCTLSAALATYLGHGLPLREAVVKAQNFLSDALAASYAPGFGAGPPNPAGILVGKGTV